MSTLDIRIEHLVYGGDGIGRLAEGRAVFVPFSIPGELVRARVIEEKSHFARVQMVEVLEPAAERIRARCKHFIVCFPKKILLLL